MPDRSGSPTKGATCPARHESSQSAAARIYSQPVTAMANASCPEGDKNDR